MLEFLNTLLIKGTNIYFGDKDKVYVISKQLIGDVFGMHGKGHVEKSKGRSINHEQFRHYKIVNLHLQFLVQINGMQRAWVFPTLSNILPLYLLFIRGRRYSIFATIMLSHW
jgi:hypothetical protein